MYCTQCGKEQLNDNTFCIYCGHKVCSTNAITNTRRSMNPTSAIYGNVTSTTQTSTSSPPRSIVIGIIIAAVALVVWVMIPILKNTSQSILTSSSPNITTSQMQRDLVGKKIPYYWNSIDFGEDAIFNYFQVIDTLTADNTVEYHIEIDVTRLYAPNFWFEPSFNGIIIMTYGQYAEGWRLKKVEAIEE